MLLCSPMCQVKGVGDFDVYLVLLLKLSGKRYRLGSQNDKVCSVEVYSRTGG